MDYITLRDRPEIAGEAARWFHEKWGIPKEAYLEVMNDYLDHQTEYGWYLCLDDQDRIAAGLGVIANDFHECPDLSPNICAVYTEEKYRGKRIAGRLLNLAVEDLRDHGISPVYLVTDHTGFYERYGWKFLEMVREKNSTSFTRMYIHK